MPQCVQSFTQMLSPVGMKSSTVCRYEVRPAIQSWCRSLSCSHCLYSLERGFHLWILLQVNRPMYTFFLSVWYLEQLY